MCRAEGDSSLCCVSDDIEARCICMHPGTVAYSDQLLSRVDGLWLGLGLVVVLLQSRKSGATIVLRATTTLLVAEVLARVRGEQT